MELYGLYPETEILEALCAMLIRGDCRETACFEWYSRALEADLSLTRLCMNVILYAMPENYDRLMSREVFYTFRIRQIWMGSLAKLFSLCEPFLHMGTPDWIFTDVRAGDGRVCGGSAFQGTG